jgi:ABC-type transport system involved in cytochrome c biogenesis ATPase subunit
MVQICRTPFTIAEVRVVFERREAASALGLTRCARACRPSRALSAGQKRRLGLARLLVRKTPVWLLDEPYASLDDAGCAGVDDLINRHLADGGGVVLATHQRHPRVDASQLDNIVLQAGLVDNDVEDSQ